MGSSTDATSIAIHVGHPKVPCALLLVVLLASGCRGDGQENAVSPSDLAARVECSDSYEAVATEALGVEEAGTCKFRGYELSFVTFADNGARNKYACSTCGFDDDTDAGVIEEAARGFGGLFVAGDRYLVRVPDATVEQAVRGALAG